jgi:hypothetical protein
LRVVPRSPAATIGRFVLDWFLFAPMALLLAWLVGRLLGANLVTPQVQSGALITYGLTFFLAFYEDLPVASWEKDGGILAYVALLVKLLYWAIIVLSFTGIVLVLALSALAKESTPELQSFMVYFGLVLVGVGAVVGVSGLAARIREGRF